MFRKASYVDLARDYLAHQLFEDFPRRAQLARRQLEKVDWDRNVLNRAGLRLHRPGRDRAGGVALFVLGALAGGAVALLLAPKAGQQLRGEVKTRAQDWMGARPGEAHDPLHARA